jgi:hypothetical protein
VLNYISYLRKINTRAIPDKLISPPEWKATLNEAHMIHAFGSNKRFWNEVSLILAYPEWQENHKLWLRKGGSDFKGQVYNKFMIPYPLTAGYLLQKVRIISLRNEIIKNHMSYNDFYCKNDVWSDSITLTSTIYRAEHFNLTISLNNSTTVNISGQIKSKLIMKSFSEKDIPATIDITEHIDCGVIKFKGSLQDSHITSFLKKLSSALTNA